MTGQTAGTTDAELDLRAYFEESHDLYCEISLDGRYRYLNQAWEAALGYKVSEMVGTHFEHWLHPEDRSESKTSFENAKAPDKGLFRNRHRHKDGHYVTFLWSGRHDVKRQTVYAHARNVTEDRRKSTILHTITEIQDTYIRHGTNKQGLFDKILAKILTATESEHGFIAEVREIDPNGAKLTNIFSSTPEFNHETVTTLTADTIETAKPSISNRTSDIHTSSDSIKIRTILTVPLHYLGEFIGIVGIANRSGGYSEAFFENIKSVIEATASVVGLYFASARENALRERFMVVVENLPIMLTEFGPDGRITWANRCYRERLVLKEADFSDANLLGITISDSKEEERARNFMLSGRTDWQDFTLTSRSGESFPSIWTNIRLKDGRAIGIGQDMTDRRAAEAKMIQSSKMASLGEMSAGVSHEINNPLTVIQGSAYRAIGNLKSAAINLEKHGDVEADLNRIIQNCDRIARIVRGLRAFSRNVEHEPFTPTPLTSVIEDVMNLAHERFVNDQIKLTIDLETQFVLECRPVQLGQVLMNLLNNAYDAVNDSNSREKSVSISAVQVDKMLQISVEDSGPGIPPDVQNRIFEPFFTTKGIGKGTGLGLSISKGIVESHHGRIWLDTAVHRTRFVIELPLRQTSSASA